MTYRSTFRLISGVAVLLACLAVAPSAHAQFGLAAGANFNSINDVTTDQGVKSAFDNAFGYHIGLFVNLNLGPIGIRPGLFYRNISDLNATVESVETDGVTLNMFEVPIDVRLRFAAPIITPYVLVGPVLTFPSSNDEFFDEGLEDVAFTVDAGFGVEIPLRNIRLFPEARFGFGVSRFVKDSYQIGDVTVTADDSQRLNSFMLRLGVGL